MKNNGRIISKSARLAHKQHNFVLCAFFEQLAAGDDPLRAKRLQLTKLTNQYTDGHSAERVAAFLAERLREREHT